jgi:leader peptidase (prepilin peptidase)/N-methyltransferase
VVVLRLEDGRPIVAGRSQCDSCHARLGPLDLVPLASWSFLRARCRHCGARLGFFYPAMEIAAIVPVVSAVLLARPLITTSVLGWCLLVAGLIGWRGRVFSGGRIVAVIAAGLWLAWLCSPIASPW